MANLKEIRSRILTVTSTRQITSAMKMVSAAKLRRAQDSLIQLRPYAGKLKEILHSLSNALEGDESNVYGKPRELKRLLLVVVTSDKGLCGAFNSNIIKKVESLAYGEYAEFHAKGRIDMITIGKKGHDLLKKRGFRIMSNRSDLYDELNFENTSSLALEVMNDFSKNRYQKVLIVYNAFKNAAVQEISAEQFLPIEFDTSEEEPEGNHMYIYEPSKADIVNELIPKSLRLQFYKALLESNTAEHGARMTAMHQATDNATELLKDLKLSYNKARQSAITTEILEISAGAEALNK